MVLKKKTQKKKVETKKSVKGKKRKSLKGGGLYGKLEQFKINILKKAIASNKYPSGTYYIVTDKKSNTTVTTIEIKALNSIDSRLKVVHENSFIDLQGEPDKDIKAGDVYLLKECSDKSLP